MTGVRRRSGAEGGFTLVELVVVIVILGIVAAVATPRFFADRTFLERGYYDELAAALRYARQLAVASGCPVRLAIDATGYAARQQRAQAGRCDPTDASFDTAVTATDGGVFAGRSPIGVTVAPLLTITFDALGRTDLPSDRSIAVGPFVLTVHADSGYVQAP